MSATGAFRARVGDFRRETSKRESRKTRVDQMLRLQPNAGHRGLTRTPARSVALPSATMLCT